MDQFQVHQVLAYTNSDKMNFFFRINTKNTNNIIPVYEGKFGFRERPDSTIQCLNSLRSEPDIQIVCFDLWLVLNISD